MKNSTSLTTMKAVAQLAGVSTATVSRVLAIPDKVAPHTRARVFAAAIQLGYGELDGRSYYQLDYQRSILVLLSNIKDDFYSEIILGIQQVAAFHQCLIFLFDTYSVSSSEKVINSRLFRCFDGIISLSAEPQACAPCLTLSNSPPSVIVNQFSINPAIPSVHIDNLSAAFEAVNYLITQGHKRIACVTGPEQWILCQYRQQGYIQALRRHNLSIEPQYITHGDFTFQAGREALERFWQQSSPPQAIFCQNDQMALGVLYQAKQLGISIPQQLSVIGFDGIIEGQFSDPPLTTIRQPCFAMGQQAMDLLLKLINNQSTPQHSHLLETELIVRQSVAYKRI